MATRARPLVRARASRGTGATISRSIFPLDHWHLVDGRRSTPRSASRPRRRSARRTSGRASSSRCSRTSSATRSRPSARALAVLDRAGRPPSPRPTRARDVDRPPDGAPRAPRGRPARRDARRARQDPAAHASASSSRRSCGAPPRTTPRSSPRAACALRDRRRRRAAARPRRSHPPRAGGREPARERRQVHGRRRARRVSRRPRGATAPSSSVADDGDGIDPAVLPRLFAPFVQADDGLDRRARRPRPGPLPRAIARRAPWRVPSRSRSGGAGRGAEFTVRLPLAADETAPRRTARDPLSGRGPRRVLVIEDNPDAAEMLRDLLDRGGARGRGRARRPGRASRGRGRSDPTSSSATSASR